VVKEYHGEMWLLLGEENGIINRELKKGDYHDPPGGESLALNVLKLI
jgi:hypothetical protein